MIRDNQKYFNRMHVIIDGLVIVISYFFAWFLKFQSGLIPLAEARLSDEYYFLPLIVIVPAFLLLYYAFNLYTSKRVQGRRVEAGNVWKANTLGTFLFIVILYMINQPDFSRQMIFIFYATNLILDVLVRNIIRMILRKIRQMGYNQKYVLLVGYSRAAEQYIDRIVSNPQWGYTIRGVLDDDIERGTVYKGVKVIGRIDNLPVILPNAQLDEIAITLSISKYERLEKIVGLCEKSGVHTKFIPDYNHIIPTRPYTEDLLGLPVVNIRHVPLTNTFNQVIKRIMDIIGSIISIILFSPVMLVTAILVKTTSKGPLIFKQERVGRHNKHFMMYKFRSMAEQKPADEEKGWTVKNDPRTTGVGKVIRKTSIDELPQLFNVLKGDMSLVGPRPERPQFVERFKEEIPRYMVKHQVRPGMTGWAQVNGYRGNTSIRKRIDCDLYYIENWTIGLDIKILIMTVFKGFVNKNAY
ncbi:MAG: undecaprenyl-phosphate glucose phosphotransferase [Lachnospiraceae bacterium]|nr:undecaprenyl-phosphate glucose phosphotransferase [Lachnospiraceae bacterium]